MNIKLLTSAMGLGTYVPALHLREYFRQQGYTVTMDVFENYFSEEVLAKYLKNKREYHKSFKVAKLGHKLAQKKLGTALEEEMIDAISKKWEKEKVQKLVILSGNWIPVVEQYRMQIHDDSSLCAVIVHMDIGTAPSWSNFSNPDLFYKEILPIDETGVQYIFEVPVPKEDTSVPKEKPVFNIHGGGWGMGDYRERKQEIQAAMDCHMFVLAHEQEEMIQEKDVQYILMDTRWKPWIADESGEYEFPVMLDGETGKKLENQSMHDLYQIYKQCDAVISKPGGGTMLDGIACEVPIVFLEPVAEHERKNQEAYEKLGLGISFSKWKESGYSLEILSELREKIRKNKKGKLGLGAYIETLWMEK
ncbi:hypothetical protein [[Clostridium] polysaccharolyticum]|uniref:UDP-N-acetylglucosamine:LPS N-acetylglucosamine transferase n=1 Tax=[Clostridium] polysaccharolyticum TaxID=29364 RepID=A0A1H9Y5R9_9FIRM|nr:hypothetical protein [[Clostridium] polysaccharolyticum]SES64079.1 UDP-N-acetylglucosamine:LPS N-acetylglucosamine transferase [[Clostridium] polysaccharolyticum]